jgi:hypothetical protein
MQRYCKDTVEKTTLRVEKNGEENERIQKAIC